MRCTLTLILLLLVSAPLAHAHIDDEARQAYATMKITDEAVEVVTTIPARYAFPVLLEGASPIELDKLEPEVMADRVEPVLAERNPVTIDGVSVRPTILGTTTNMTNSRLPARSFIEPQIMQYGELVYLARYETKGAPRRVSIAWDLFVPEYNELGEAVPDSSSPVPVSLKVQGKRKLLVLTEDEPGYTWHSETSASVPASLLVNEPVQRERRYVPVMSIAVLAGGLLAACLVAGWPKRAGVVALGVVLAGAAWPVSFGRVVYETQPVVQRPAEGEALELFRSLHANIYRAFDYTDEGAIYDALAQSVDGPMLETIYNDIYQSLILREEGGAVCKVQRVTVDEAAVLDAPADEQAEPEAGAYRVRAEWTVDGLVQHHGHTHGRTNAFEAVYTVAPRGGSWRIVDAEILDQRRIDDGAKGVSG